MKIRKVSCEQFAGLRDVEVTFDDGINVVYGKNEAGKSTLVDLISRTLFQNTKIDRRKDKTDGFVSAYMPAQRRGGKQGDSIDGTVVIEAGEGRYTLKKGWGETTNAQLTLPTMDKIKSLDTIDQELRKLLQYGEGVYRDMLFSSQHSTDKSLKMLLGELDKKQEGDTRQEIVDVLSRAFLQSDGISVNVIEEKIAATITSMSNNWDAEKSEPRRHTGGGRHARNVGEVLTAYYALEDRKDERGKILELEEKAERATRDYEQACSCFNDSETAFDNFNAVANQLTIRKDRQKVIDTLRDKLKELCADLQNWPAQEALMHKALALKEELTQRILHDRYEQAQNICGERDRLESEIAAILCPTTQEISDIKNVQADILRLQNQLCGMNLSAIVHMMNGHHMEIVSVQTGEALDLTDEAVSINEAVRITVPGVMELQLAPANVDVAQIEKQLSDKKKFIAGVFETYQADAVEQLEGIARTVEAKKATLDETAQQLEAVLAGETLESLQEKINAKAIRTAEALQTEIKELCGAVSIDAYIAVAESDINRFCNTYGTLEQLEKEYADTLKDLKEKEASIAGMKAVSEEFAFVADPEKHIKLLKENMEKARQHREDMAAAKKSARDAADRAQENISYADAEEKVKEAEQELEDKKALLSHWRHIQAVFTKLKESSEHNPIQGLAVSFAEYLNLISGGRVDSSFPDSGKLDMNIYSDNRLLDYTKLSEGTKDTVALAFRLAVLDHLFPDGGGVIVLDDPFTDMDIERVKRSCALVKKCAERHQVIFLTCREEYFPLLGGNLIRM